MDKLPPEAWDVVKTAASEIAVDLMKNISRDPPHPELEFAAQIRALTLAATIIIMDAVENRDGLKFINAKELADEYAGFVEDAIAERRGAA